MAMVMHAVKARVHWHANCSGMTPAAGGRAWKVSQFETLQLSHGVTYTYVYVR